MKIYSIKETKKDQKGQKTTITVTTENPEVIRKIMTTASQDNIKSSERKEATGKREPKPVRKSLPPKEVPKTKKNKGKSRK